MNCNGTRTVILKTLHGSFSFPVQRFEDKRSGSTPTWFELTGEFQRGYHSQRLQELAAYYSNRLSYEEVAGLVKRMTGESSMSDQGIWRMVMDRACQVSLDLQHTVSSTLEEPGKAVPLINTEVEIYNPDVEEVLVFDDAILVKGQKEHREKSGSRPQEQADSTEHKTPRVSTDVVMLQTGKGKFEYLTEPIDAEGMPLISMDQVVKARIIHHYGHSDSLNIVAVTDGARTIRNRLFSVFGPGVVILLDWFHLLKKVRDYMSMIARNKAEKQEHIREVLRSLWKGDAPTAMKYLKTRVYAKNVNRREELIDYLTRHQAEIIDYGRRQQAGKTIGSGRGEKAVDQVIGSRQKQKGRSWAKSGSKALGILKTVELNHQWEQFWFPQQKAS